MLVVHLLHSRLTSTIAVHRETGRGAATIAVHRERVSQPPYKLPPARAGPAGCSARTDASPVRKDKGWRSGVTSNVLLPVGLPAGFEVPGALLG